MQPKELEWPSAWSRTWSSTWKPEDFHDAYRDDLLKMIEEKASGKVKPEPKARRETRQAKVIDFAALLERSLTARRKGGEAADGAAPRRRPGAPQRTPKTAAARTKRKATTHRTAAGHRRAA